MISRLVQSPSLSLSLSLSYRLMRENAQVKYAKVIQPLHPRGKLVFTTKSVVGLYAIHGPHTLPPTLNKRSVFNIYRSSVLWNNPNNEAGSSKWRKRKQGKRKKPHERPLFHLKKKKKVTTIPSWLAHDEPMIHLFFFFSLSPIEQTATYFHFYPFPFLQRHYCNGGGWGVCNAFKSRLSLSLSAPCSPFLLFLKKIPPFQYTHTPVHDWSVRMVFCPS